MQFFIASGSQAPYWLDGKHVVFGKVWPLLAKAKLTRHKNAHRGCRDIYLALLAGLQEVPATNP